MGHPPEDFVTGGLLCWIGQPVLGISCIGHDDGGEVRVTVAGGGEEIDCPMIIEAIGLFRMSSCVEIQDTICLVHRTGSDFKLRY
jgi:hypothetical protein